MNGTSGTTRVPFVRKIKSLGCKKFHRESSATEAAVFPLFALQYFVGGAHDINSPFTAEKLGGKFLVIIVISGLLWIFILVNFFLCGISLIHTGDYSDNWI